jgi:hypothetical protein
MVKEINLGQDRAVLSRKEIGKRMVEANTHANKLKEIIAQLDEAKTCISTMRYAGKPLPIRFTEDNIDHAKMFLVVALQKHEKDVRDNEFLLRGQSQEN